MRVIDDVGRDWWLEVARRSETATFFHTPIWEHIVTNGLGGSATSRTLGFETSSGVRAVLPATTTRQLGPLSKVESTGEGCYGGLIADGALTDDELRAISQAATRRGVLTFDYLESPLGDANPLHGAGAGWSVDREESAWSIDLHDDFEQVFSGFQKRLREHYRSGLRKGVTINAATSLDDYRVHYDAYRDAVDRWGEDDGYGYDWNLFQVIHEAATSAPANIRLWLINVGEEPVGGRLVFYWNRHATLWHGSARREFLNHQVMPVADTEVARDAATRGFACYDLNTTGDHQGVIRYKQRFSPREVPLRYWTYVSPAMSAVRGARGLGETVLDRVRRRIGQPGGEGSSAPDSPIDD